MVNFMQMKKTIIIFIIGIILLATVAVVAVKIIDKESAGLTAEIFDAEEKNNGPVYLPREILDNKFGFLSGHQGSEKEIAGTGARWARPHSGPFVWDMMQKSQTSKMDFSYTDKFIKDAQKNKLGTLATIFPYADWEQKQRTNPEKCRVPANDAFAPEGRNKEGKMEFYLPYYRCNPTNWGKYSVWLKALVERYDGDGVDDMPGLQLPVKYWEISNEPDLLGPEDFDEPQPDSLTFFVGEPEDYAALLKKSYQFIKEADPDAKVLISGAAGGGDWSLKYYRRMFKDETVKNYFDIANVHCISNDSYDSFNVELYQKMLAEFGIQKPIWVTEAEAIVADTAEGNIKQTKESSKKALTLGAEKIFYTRFSFEPDGRDKKKFENQDDMKIKKDDGVDYQKEKPEEEEMGEGKPWIKDSMDEYKKIFQALLQTTP